MKENYRGQDPWKTPFSIAGRTSTVSTSIPDVALAGSKELDGLDAIIQAGYDDIGGIAVIQHGEVLFERYYHGFDPETQFHVASVTKSIVSALVGIAIKDGYLEGIDQKVVDFFPGYPRTKEPGLIQRITLRQLLTMTVPYPYPDWQEPFEQLTMSSDWIGYALGMMGKGGVLGTFKYSSSGAHVVSAILSMSIGKSAREFANDVLFSSCGMKTIPDFPVEYSFEGLFGNQLKGWVHDPMGISTGGWGLNLTTRDMARFGLLYLNHGVWEGRQVVPSDWVESSVAMNPNHYGYFWWLFDDPEVFAFAAMGDGGTMICCIPQFDTVVAIAAQFVPAPADRWQLVKRYILPLLSS